MSPPNILLVTFPGQGHINPSLNFAKRLIRIGAHVTFSTAVSAQNFVVESKAPPPSGLSFLPFSDGYDEGYTGTDVDHYINQLTRLGPESLKNIIETHQADGQRFTHVFFTVLIPWVAEVADSLELKSTLVWIQPATVFDIYYYYFNGYKEVIENALNEPSSEIQLPKLPTLSGNDVPSFFSPTNPHSLHILLWEKHFDILKKERNPNVLVNTFDALEPEQLKAIEKLNLISIGPLVPSAVLDGNDPSDTSSGGDLFQSSRDYMDWLNARPKASVVYISFGSLSILSKPQKEEIARALIEIGRPFLWVIRQSKGDEKEEDRLSCQEELEKLGMIVPWCSQVEVLSHPSTGCFVTHCGWNSTLESLVCGVPMVAFPQWSDQQSNAKLIQDVWKTGVKLRVKEDGVVEGEEIKRCLDLVLGSEKEAEEMRKNAKIWNKLAKEAGREGGSSDCNLRAFIEEIKEACIS